MQKARHCGRWQALNSCPGVAGNRNMIKQDKLKLAISFSGGRSSAAMTKRCLEKYGDTHEIVVLFANTGCELPATLDFVRDCDEYWGFNTVWLEAIIDPRENHGTKHKVVDYKSACRGLEIFDAFAAKYGIPNAGAKMGCTREMKRQPINSYLKSIGWNTGKNPDHKIAIGYRADEIDRIPKEERVIMPLMDWGWNKNDVDNYMSQFPFDLKIPSDAYGNCTLIPCHKKALESFIRLRLTIPNTFIMLHG